MDIRLCSNGHLHIILLFRFSFYVMEVKLICSFFLYTNLREKNSFYFEDLHSRLNGGDIVSNNEHKTKFLYKI